jgi:hypothetical protein
MIATGRDYVCGRQTNGYLYCWGDNAYGVFGVGWSGFRLAPVAVIGGYTFLAPPLAEARPTSTPQSARAAPR